MCESPISRPIPFGHQGGDRVDDQHVDSIGGISALVISRPARRNRLRHQQVVHVDPSLRA